MGRKLIIKILYIFKEGRLDKLNQSDSFPKEFFYSYDYLKNIDEEVDLIEVTDKSTESRLYNFIDTYFSKFFQISFSTSKLLNIDYLQKIKEAEYIIATNHGLGVSINLLLFLKRVKNKKILIINSGLFEVKVQNYLRKKLKNFVIRFTILNSEKIIFTSHNEYEYALKKLPRLRKKLFSLPFCIDTDFWNSENLDTSKKEGILFVGNNEFRDINKLIEISKSLQDIKFTFVTSLINKSTALPHNVELIDGDWNKSIIGDLDLKKFYKAKKLTILPIKDTEITASGQSVAMQSIAVGTPVIINYNNGFWDKKNLSVNSGLILVDNSIEEWTSEIMNIYYDEQKLNNIAVQGIENIKKNYNQHKFNIEIAKLCGVVK